MKTKPLPKLPRLPRGFALWSKPRRGPLKRKIEMGSYLVTNWEGPDQWETPRPLNGDTDNLYIIAIRIQALPNAMITNSRAQK